MKKALVLAAGLGTRLQPFTRSVPKALMPVWGVPLLELALRKLEAWDVEEIVVNAHAHADRIAEFLQTRKGKARLRLSRETEILGTGGALRPLRVFFSDGPFWMLNADVVSSVAPEPIQDAFEKSGRFASVWLEASRGPRTVEADRKRRITCFHSATPGLTGTFTLCGLHLLSPEIFSFLPDRTFSSIVEAYEAAMAAEKYAVGSVQPGSYWADCGTPDSFRKVHGEIKSLAIAHKPGGEFYQEDRDRISPQERHFFCVSSSAKVSAESSGRDSILLDGTELTSGSKLDNCIAAGGCIGGHLQKVNTVALSEEGFQEHPLFECCGKKWSAVQPLGARGSNRSFWRLFDGDKTAIAITYSGERPENTRYAGHCRLLAEAGIPVPKVLEENAAARVIVLEDFGNDSLQSRVCSRPYDAVRLYTPAVRALARLHREVTRLVRARDVELEAPFDATLYDWERGLFVRHLLDSRYGMETLPEDVDKELRSVADALMKQPQVVIHRDMQSSNVLLKGSRMALIDFQGMRFGAAAYDLASLLFDPYVPLCAADRGALAKEYAAACPEQVDAAGSLFHTGAVQRLVQALGAYGRLFSVGQSGFTQYILPGLERLHDVSKAAGYHALHELCEELIIREKMRPDCARDPAHTKARS